MTLEVGARLGSYEVVNPLGAGGMGEVFRAHDADGQRVDEIASALRLTRNTVRWYVKRALAKTGVSTQAQVVRLVLSSLDIR